MRTVTDTSDAPLKQAPTERVRWDIIALSFLYGGVAIFCGAMFAYERVQVTPDVSSFWSGLLVNVGTTLLLAGALIWFEKAIIAKVQEVSRSTLARVQTANSEAITQAANAAAAKVALDTEGVKAQLDDLDRRLKADEDAVRNARVDQAARIPEDYGFDTIRKVLRDAGDIGAVTSVDRLLPDDDGKPNVIVSAGRPPTGVRLKVTYEPPSWGSKSNTLEIEVFGEKVSPVVWKAEQGLDEIW